MSRDGISKFIFCPMAQPDIGEAERGYINEAVIPGDIGKGKFVQMFEESWSLYNKYRFGVACNNGTSALHLAVLASGAKKIAVPNFTMAATAWGAMYDGEVGYYKTRQDLPLGDWATDFSGYDAVIFAHIYGRRAYPEGFVSVLKAKHPHLIVIDDMAEAHGVFPEGDIACYSFYANKILTTGEGGMCLTNNQEYADEMRSLSDMYFDKERSMIHPKVGHNYRMTNIQAAIGLAQSERVDFILQKRQKIQDWYDLYMPESVQLPRREVLWYYDIKVPNAEKVQRLLKSKGYDSRRFFYPLSLQPWGDKTPDYHGLRWYKHGLLLPVHNHMVEQDTKELAELVAEGIAGYKREVVI